MWGNEMPKCIFFPLKIINKLIKHNCIMIIIWSDAALNFLRNIKWQYQISNIICVFWSCVNLQANFFTCNNINIWNDNSINNNQLSVTELYCTKIFYINMTKVNIIIRKHKYSDELNQSNNSTLIYTRVNFILYSC